MFFNFLFHIVRVLNHFASCFILGVQVVNEKLDIGGALCNTNYFDIVNWNLKRVGDTLSGFALVVILVLLVMAKVLVDFYRKMAVILDVHLAEAGQITSCIISGVPQLDSIGFELLMNKLHIFDLLNRNISGNSQVLQCFLHSLAIICVELCQ